MKLIIQPFFKISTASITVCMLVVGVTAFSQGNVEKLLLVKANELIYSNPDESIKIANHLIKKSENDGEAVLNILLSKSYLSKGDYNQSIAYIFEAGKEFKSVNDSVKTEILFTKADISQKLHLFTLMHSYIAEINTIIKDFKSTDIRKAAEVNILLENIYEKLENQKYAQALKDLDTAEEINTAIYNPGLNKKSEIYFLRGLINSVLSDLKISEINFNKSLEYYKTQKLPNKILEANILLGLGKLYFKKEEYSQAIKVLSVALAKAKELSNKVLQESINLELSVNYMALNDKGNHLLYYNNFSSLNSDMSDMENQAVNSMYNFVSDEQDDDFNYIENRMLLIIYTALACVAITVTAGLLLYRFNKAKRKRLKEIIGYLEVTNNLLVKSYVDKKEVNKKLAISTETEQNILSKLKKFENSSKYTNKDMSLATLAAQLDINTKYLSEIINKHYNDNFNTYINKLRINYIIEKLKNEPEYLNYKISYLAEESGFSSHSSFATVFKSITGIAPTVFIDLIGKEVTQKKA